MWEYNYTYSDELYHHGIVNKQLREDADKKRKDALERAKRKP